MNNDLDLGTIRKFVDALLIGALVGIEREKHKSAEPEAGIAGLRTFVTTRSGKPTPEPGFPDRRRRVDYPRCRSWRPVLGGPGS
jgi:hypothetical protein